MTSKASRRHGPLSWLAAIAALIGLIGHQQNCFAAAVHADAIAAISEIGPRLSFCWHPPHPGDEITIKLSFNRSGGLIGRPRMTFIKSVAGTGIDNEVALANSIFSAVYDCTPLHFTDALGASIAGRVLILRFIAAPARTQSVSL